MHPITFARMTAPTLPHDQEEISLGFRLTKGWLWLWYTLPGVLLYQLFTLQRPGFGELGPLLDGRIGDYFRNLLGYYFLFELVSVFIFIRLVRRYATWVGMLRVEMSARGVLLHQLKFLPYVLGVIFVFGPITNGLRYLAVFYPDYAWSTYFPEYFFTPRMYVNYLLPFLVFGYSLMNVDLFLDYYAWQKKRFEALTAGNKEESSTHFLRALEASDEQGDTLLPVAEIWWFEVEGKNYTAFTQGKTYSIRKNLSELESVLDPEQYYRVNRAVIVNLAFLKNYSFWEHDKYILRMKDDKTTFVMQRARLKNLRQKMGWL